MTVIPQPERHAGNSTLTWDAWNRLVNLVDTATEDTVAEYPYDGRHWRVVAKHYSGGSLNEARHFYYTGRWQCLEERVDSATSPDRQYVWGKRYVDDLILRDRDTNTNGILDERLYALQDANWNVAALADNTTAVQERYAYDAYGKVSVLEPNFTEDPNNTSDLDMPYLYTGRVLDVETGLYFYRARYYHAALAAFVSRDPIGYAARDVNVYRYVRNNVTAQRDPQGLISPSHASFIAMVGTERGRRQGYLYFDVVGMDSFFDHLANALFGVSDVKMVSWTWSGGIGGYQPAFDTISILEGLTETETMNTLIHELVHAADSQNDWSGGKDAEERLAYAVDYLLFIADGLERFEQTLKTRGANLSCKNYQDGWRDLVVAQFSNAQSGYAIATRPFWWDKLMPIGEVDYYRVSSLLGLDFYCMDLAKVYETALLEAGVQGDLGIIKPMGLPCRCPLSCDGDLWSRFLFGPNYWS